MPFNSPGETPLHIAVLENNRAVVELLLDGGADSEATDEYGKMSLMTEYIVNTLMYWDIRIIYLNQYGIIVIYPVNNSEI